MREPNLGIINKQTTMKSVWDKKEKNGIKT